MDIVILPPVEEGPRLGPAPFKHVDMSDVEERKLDLGWDSVGDVDSPDHPKEYR